MKKMKRLACLFLLVSTLFAPMFASGSSESSARSSLPASIRNTEISQTLAEINTLYQYLEANYLYEISLDDVEENLTRALMASLNDPYSEYIEEDDADEMEEKLSGTYVGIGVYVSKYDPLFIDWDKPETYMLQVTAPFPGGPADLAGLRAKDLISHINGESLAQLDAKEASKLLRGEEGVPLTIIVHRGDAVFELEITPEKVTTPNVKSTIIPDTTYGYLAIYDFNESTYNLVSENLSTLSYNGITALIIDLRNNQGGTVNTACMVANFFTDTSDTVLTIEYKEGSGRSPQRLIASDQTRKYRLPVVILVNGGTASASEILAAALQDNNKATIIGGKTFGKGIIQEIVPWKKGYIRYTSAHYLTPNGKDIHEVGITPDISVQEPELTADEMEEYYTYIADNAKAMSTWIEENPSYSEENVEAFIALHEGEFSFDPLYLKLALRNQYMTAMDYEDRPVVDTLYDIYLIEAINYLDSL